MYLRVQVYKNLHKDCYSVRHCGRVIAHCGAILLENVEFRVQPAGRNRVLRDRRKNVHAFVVGDISSSVSIPKHAVKVRYNPYENDSFVRLDTGVPVNNAVMCWLTPTGVFAQLE
jgi:hypothetical protein